MGRVFSGLLWIFALALMSGGASAADRDFTIAPYVYSIQGNKIAISWQYRALRFPPKRMKAELALFQAGQSLKTVPATVDRGLYTAVLPFPACGWSDQISYQVPGQSAPRPLVSVPCADFKGTTRFSFLADTQDGPGFVSEFAEAMRQFPGTAIINGGDLVQTGSDQQQWLDYFQAMEPVGGERVLYPVVGNHEYRDKTDIPLWTRHFGFKASDAHYAFDLGPARVIVLNSCFEDDRSQASKQIPWLRAELARPARWKIVVFHHPPYSIGLANSSLAPKKEWKVIQENYVPLFEAFGVNLVLSGHTHIFERSYRNGIHYLTAGPGGGRMGVAGAENPYSVVSSHVRTVTHFELDSNALRATSVGLNGEIVDDFILRK